MAKKTTTTTTITTTTTTTNNNNNACRLSFTENFFLSGTAAVISKTAVAPVERVKLLLQNQPELIRSGRVTHPYSGPIDCTLRVFRAEGLLAFWRSNMVNCIRYFPTQALNFAFKDQIKRLMKTPAKDTNTVRVGKNILAGGTAGALSTCFVYSLDFARTLLANDAKDMASTTSGVSAHRNHPHHHHHHHQQHQQQHHRKYSGLIDVYRQTVRQSGLSSLYTGFLVSVVAIFVYRGLYFGLYDSLKPVLSQKQAGLLPYFLMGYGVTVTANLIAYPIDTVRRRMMVAVGQSLHYRGALQCAVHIVRTEGFGPLMKGSGVNVVRSLAGGGVLVGFESFTEIYGVWKMKRREERVQ